MLESWETANQSYLAAALDEVAEEIENSIAQDATAPVNSQASLKLKQLADSMAIPPALEQVCAIFQLSAFERRVLLLCAGIEVDSRFESLCATVHGVPTKTYPTFGLAQVVFDQFHWSAMTPNRPLRYWKLLHLGDGNALTQQPLRINERILHYLAGIEATDPELLGLMDVDLEIDSLVSSHQTLIQQIVTLWQASELPVVQLCGAETDDKTTIATTIADKLSLNLRSLPADHVPIHISELDTFIRHWQREALLTNGALLIRCDDFDRLSHDRISSIVHLIEQIHCPILIISRESLSSIQRPSIRCDVPKPTSEEQFTIWQAAIHQKSSAKSNRKLRELCAQFNLSTSMIQSAIAATHQTKNIDQLWEACRVQARPRLDELAERIESSVSWQDLVLPNHQQQVLSQIAAHVRQRATVYETWGFSSKNKRGLGISALFAGSSGTGKTLAAEVLAHELKLDLYKINLSSVISKYIGETEKNLQRIFDAAATGGVILLFDEADALFGKRSEVKDSRDRYANIEVSYLLQQMEAYTGLAILTTNLQSHLDSAFLRRLRFVVQFPFPDANQRSEIWRRIFPASTPTANLDVMKLAQLNLAGGNIRNIALNSAFIAADAGEPIQMKHLLQAAQSEYAKLEKSLTEVEIAGWL
ncbi:ATP-binding protein [Pseudanabaenaceae cyanobacterium LEGE 13415]|nr:ATP-binding protein [Pseudanabaenaceae cyanobacterium LEGE 13415]